MKKLIKNEFFKLKIAKIALSYAFFVIFLLFFYKFTKKNIQEISYNLIFFVGFFICLFFGGTISSEIEKGTFKFYLTKPVSRHKIYVSKLLASYIYSYISVLIILIFTSLFWGKIDLLYFSKFLTYSIPLYFLSTLIIFFSCRFKNTSFTICIGILLFSFSLLVSQLLFEIHFKFIEYTFLPYLDFTLFDDIDNLKLLNNEFNTSLSLKRGVLIDIIYTFIFYLLGSLSFIRKDIRS